jgi:hypothetical protein
MDQDKALSQVKSDQPKPLTPKNKAFLQHLAAGRPTLEAYSLAGYKGEAHAAYQLRSELKAHLAILLEQGGFSRESLAAEVNKLNAIPLDPSIKNVNFKQKLDILRLMEKALPKPIENRINVKITPFTLVGIRKEAPKEELRQESAIDAEIVEPAPRSEGQDGL